MIHRIIGGILRWGSFVSSLLLKSPERRGQLCPRLLLELSRAGRRTIGGHSEVQDDDYFAEIQLPDGFFDHLCVTDDNPCQGRCGVVIAQKLLHALWSHLWRVP